MNSNNFNLIGNLIRDPELVQVANGKYIKCEFTVAWNNPRKKPEGDEKPKPSFFNCEVWGKQAEAFHRFHRKGSRATITGYLDQEHWTDNKSGEARSAFKVKVDDFTRPEVLPDEGRTPQSNSAPPSTPVEDAEVPF